jgi:predicted metalloprotease
LKIITEPATLSGLEKKGRQKKEEKAKRPDKLLMANT